MKSTVGSGCRLAEKARVASIGMLTFTAVMVIASAQTPPTAPAAENPSDDTVAVVNNPSPPISPAGTVPEPRNGEGLEGSLTVRRNARTMSLSIPAPRGQITDRHGAPFAQNKVVWYPALKYVQFEKADRSFVIDWARKRVNQANELFNINWKVTDEELWQHYRHRRWLAMPVTHVVDVSRKKELESKLMSGLILHPVYMRHYPQGEAAAHIIGYVGSVGPLEKGPINYGDPIFERVEGRSGLEKIFEKTLTGKEGLLRKDYESDGTLVLKKYSKRPRPGGTVVTTLDMEWQKHAENVLKRYSERGAFVVIDIHTGEVLTMASRPSFNLNDFIPYISTEKYSELREDPGTPLFARAFQGGYPPASTFKPVVAATALSNGEVHEWSLINCPAKIKIGNHWFHNWSKSAEGNIDVKRAIARSCNPWFYKVGIQTGPSAFLSVARRLGFGSKTGLPLIGETEGLIPTNEWMKKYHKRSLMDGDTANLSIGQGVMLASPLQVAQGMAGLANGTALPKLRLVRQQQDVSGRVLVSNNPERRNFLNLDPEAVHVVHEGMMQVVHAGYGTGKRGKLSYTVLCGKTGTAQWGPKSKEQRLAWFSGFFPLENPRYAFAALYEGKPGERLSGGRKAAPMVSAFFEHFKKDIKKAITPPPKAMVIEEDDEVGTEDDEGRILDVESAPRAIPVEEEDEGILPEGDSPRRLRAIPVEEDEEDGSLPPTPSDPRPLPPSPEPIAPAPPRAQPVEEDDE
ncbi:MAG: penicillin-binding transpeptidase domain-containing protein [Akkermansiaceae bacterium]